MKHSVCLDGWQMIPHCNAAEAARCVLLARKLRATPPTQGKSSMFVIRVASPTLIMMIKSSADRRDVMHYPFSFQYLFSSPLNAGSDDERLVLRATSKGGHKSIISSAACPASATHVRTRFDGKKKVCRASGKQGIVAHQHHNQQTHHVRKTNNNTRTARSQIDQEWSGEGGREEGSEGKKRCPPHSLLIGTLRSDLLTKDL